jgi:V8-like Glu-specific endopeptidase
MPKGNQAGVSAHGEADDLAIAGPTLTAIASQPRASHGSYQTREVEGNPYVPSTSDTETTGAYAEIKKPAATVAVEAKQEATPAQITTAEAGSGSAIADLAGIPGFQAPAGDQEAVAVVEPVLREAGTAIAPVQQDGREEFGFLAALVPTLISSVGPAVAKGVISRLSPKARAAIPRVARASARVLATAPRRPGPGTALHPPAGGNGGLLATLAQLLQSQAAKATGEAVATEVDPVVEEAARVLEVLIGNDDRVRIEQTTDVPWRRYCALRITFPTGVFRGTGFLIGPRAVATAGHCVYMHDQSGWAQSIEVIPGANGPERPFGTATATSFRSIAGWVNDRNAETDIGCIELPADAFGGLNLGSFGFAVLDAEQLKTHSAVVAGYPGDKPFAEMWGMAQFLKAVTANTLIYLADTYGGQSGTAVYQNVDGQRVVVGIHNYGASGGNSATRVTQPIYERLLAWSQL